MSKVAVLTDSASDIPFDLAEKYGVDIMCFGITVDGVGYTERKDFDFDEFYKLARTCQNVPTTSHITSISFCEKYCEYDDNGYTDVLHITINRTGSATYDAAVLAEQQFREERPDSKMRIHLVDSHTYSMVYGWFVCEAAKKLKNGAEVSDVIAYLNDVFARMEIALASYTLKFMKKSGRISAAAAFAGELLGLKPIVSLNDGISKVENKVRGDAAVLPALISLTKKNMTLDNTDYFLGVTDNDDRTAEFAKLCKKEFGHPPVYIFKLGAAVTINTGPEAVAIVYFGKKRER